MYSVCVRSVSVSISILCMWVWLVKGCGGVTCCVLYVLCKYYSMYIIFCVYIYYIYI